MTFHVAAENEHNESEASAMKPWQLVSEG
jgi:hypothetical protein